MPDKDDWIVIGEITKTHGLKGGLRVRPLTDDPARFHDLKTVRLQAANGSTRACTVTEVRSGPPGVILFCREFSRIEQVEPFVGGTVWIPSDEAIPLPEGRFFQHDLLGLKVYLEEGRYLGEIREIWPTGSNDVLVVREGSREHLIPAIKDVVLEVNLPEKKMILRPIEGLLETE